jgi:two-component system response regulator QseB
VAVSATAIAIGQDGRVSAPPRPLRLLLVEDDRSLAQMLVGLLTTEGYAVEHAPDGQRGLHLGLTRSYDLMVMDRGLPSIEGLDLIARLRSRGVTTPTLVLSALGNPSDRVEGLDAGAEDYLSKPFDVDELLARLRALSRRHRDTARLLLLPGGRLDLDSRQVRAGGSSDERSGSGSGNDGAVQLSERECSLLAALGSRPTRVFGRGELLTLVFGDAESEVVVDTYVHYLRRKLGRAVVRTVRGRGYQLGHL